MLGVQEATVYVSMAGGRVFARAMEAAAMSMKGMELNLSARSAVVYVSMAENLLQGAETVTICEHDRMRTDLQ
jgi:hypothetical protein